MKIFIIIQLNLKVCLAKRKYSVSVLFGFDVSMCTVQGLFVIFHNKLGSTFTYSFKLVTALDAAHCFLQIQGIVALTGH